MTLDRATLAFMAARFPALYAAGTLTHRLAASGATDTAVNETTVADALRRLHKGGFVELQVDYDGTEAWGATPEGIRRWRLDGGVNV